MIKKIISAILCICVLTCSTLCLAADAIRVELDYVPVTFDQEPVIVNDRTMVPVRAIFEALGASVSWNADTRTVTSHLDNLTVIMAIDNLVMTINGAVKTMDAAPVIIGNRTLVPVRAVAESFGCTVEWNSDKRLVSIFSQRLAERAKKAETFSCVKPLANGEMKASAAFSISYFPEYTIKTDTADGTDFEIFYTSDTAHVSLNIRTDLYQGTIEPVTKDYADSVAEGIVTVLSGNLVNADVANIQGTDFVYMQYTAPGIVHGVTDLDPVNTICIARKDGVTYTMTYTVYGEPEAQVISDFGYMMQSLFIA